MKNYIVTLEKTISIMAENEEDMLKRVKNIESNENKNFIKIKDFSEEPKCRYVTFEELIDMYSAPKSPIERMEAVYKNESIVWFSIKFKDLKYRSTLMVKQLGQPAPTDAPYWLKREVED